MTLILLNFNTKDIKSYVVDGEPWLKCIDVPSILGYALLADVVREHVPENYKNALGSLMVATGSTKTALDEHTDNIAIIIYKNNNVQTWIMDYSSCATERIQTQCLSTTTADPC